MPRKNRHSMTRAEEFDVTLQGAEFWMPTRKSMTHLVELCDTEEQLHDPRLLDCLRELQGKALEDLRKLWAERRRIVAPRRPSEGLQGA